MQRTFFKIFAVALLLTLAAYGQQPLGDVARQYREKKDADQTAATPKVITNQDLGEDPNAPAPPPAAQKPARPAPKTSTDHAAQQAQADEREAQRWRGPILEQKRKIAYLQSQIDQANANIRSTYGSAAVDGPFTRPLVQAQQKVAQMQLQLEDLKRRLEDMQDAARRAGMQSQVYDP
jgi:hypothetical protein